MTPKTIIKNSIGPFNKKRQVKFWFDFLNKEIFHNCLKYFDYVDVSGKLSKEYLGRLYYYESEDTPPIREYGVALQPDMPYEEFLGTLAHEMVHLYQGQIQNNFAFPEPEDDITFHVFQARLKPFGLSAL